MFLRRWITAAFLVAFSGFATQATAQSSQSPTFTMQPIVSEGESTNAAATYAVTPSVATAATAPTSVQPEVIYDAVPASTRTTAMPYLNRLQQSGQAPVGDYGFILMDAQTGAVISEQNADTPLAPSSMAKMVSAVAIMEAMGPDGRLRTTVLADGPIEGGVLNGDLHLVGSGDPSLSTDDIVALAQRVADSGVRSVSGSFYYHVNAIPALSEVDPSQAKGRHWNTGLGGLNLDYNDRNGGSVSRPGRYTATAFRRYLGAAGVSIPAPKRANAQPVGDEIAVHESPTIAEILYVMFRWSRNMTSEALGAIAAASLGPKPGTLAEAAQTTTTWLKREIGSIGGAEWAGFNFPDHSGLSARSRATVRQMAAITRFAYQRYGAPFTGVYKVQSSGSDGGVDFAVRAKIGTQSYHRALAGVFSLAGRDMIFAIMANDPARRTRHPETWMMSARKLEQAIISDWMTDQWPSTVH